MNLLGFIFGKILYKYNNKKHININFPLNIIDCHNEIKRLGNICNKYIL